MKDKLNVFISVKLEEIKATVKDNSRNIADVNLRLMKLDEDVADVKELLKSLINAGEK
ncbi:hypothetical protein [Tissierella sp.]|uniref:hypothetical protein n=1 Tax=Tissierella sp. TaxID=41274 RepID=UPI0028AF835F|nr:hypothetical protein [Tissierella sp.]